MIKTPFDTTAAYCLTALLSVFFLTGAAILVDPTRPPDSLLPASSKTTSHTGPLQVSAIFIYQNYRFAIVSGQKVVPGDKVGEYTIINIQRDTVELKGSQDQSIVLSILPTVKQSR
jgi:hypothetical protein